MVPNLPFSYRIKIKGEIYLKEERLLQEQIYDILVCQIVNEKGRIFILNPIKSVPKRVTPIRVDSFAIVGLWETHRRDGHTIKSKLPGTFASK